MMSGRKNDSKWSWKTMKWGGDEFDIFLAFLSLSILRLT
jgi:hypothetical protein